jgi:hypothetical protein
MSLEATTAAIEIALKRGRLSGGLFISWLKARDRSPTARGASTREAQDTKIGLWRANC